MQKPVIKEYLINPLMHRGTSYMGQNVPITIPNSTHDPPFLVPTT